MTDNEIMRALELFKSGKDENFAFVSGNALDLINRQKAEIERLTAHLEELADEVEDKMTYMCGCKNCIETVKRIIKDDVKPFDMYCDSCNRCKHRETEAVKEFANVATSMCYEEFVTELEIAHTFAEIINETLKKWR